MEVVIVGIAVIIVTIVIIIKIIIIIIIIIIVIVIMVTIVIMGIMAVLGGRIVTVEQHRQGLVDHRWFVGRTAMCRRRHWGSRATYLGGLVR